MLVSTCAGAEAFPFQLDLQDEKQVQACVDATIKKFKRIDILVNNASALWWQDIVDTPMKKFDLILSINARGTFCMTRACLPHMKRNGFGRIITMSPPLSNAVSAYKGRTAYNISKYGMTMVTMGVAAEYGTVLMVMLALFVFLSFSFRFLLVFFSFFFSCSLSVR